MTNANTADHGWLAEDDLSDAAPNMGYWLNAAGFVIPSLSVPITVTSDTVGHVPLTIAGFSAAQTGNLLNVNQTGTTQIFALGTVASAVNGLKVTASATGDPALIAAIGTDGAVGLKINAKSTGVVTIGDVSTGGVLIGGNLTMADAKNIVVNAGTGTKIGTATTQKIGFFNSTPITQPAITGALSTVADAPAKAVLQSIIAALKATGLGLVADTTS